MSAMKHLSRDMDKIKRRTLSMGALVEAAADLAINALLNRKAALATQVVEGDARIDLEEVELEEECLKVLALHQPFAEDLRFIIMVLKVNNDLERMGDLAVNIAERAEYLSSVPELNIPLPVPEMAEKVRRMVRDALDSLVDRDTELARKVIDADDRVDELHRETYSALMRIMKADPEVVERASCYISASRNLERIADLATNIAEDVIFLVKGDVVRHKSVE
jgi:phosphate transport system protein